jgi:hypothetical protein
MLTVMVNFDILLLDDFFLRRGDCVMFGYGKKTILIQFFDSLSIPNLFLTFPIDVSQLGITQLFTFNIYLNFRNNN